MKIDDIQSAVLDRLIVCSTCKTRKPIDAYYTKGARLSSRCKSCELAAKAKRRKDRKLEEKRRLRRTFDICASQLVQQRRRSRNMVEIKLECLTETPAAADGAESDGLNRLLRDFVAGVILEI